VTVIKEFREFINRGNVIEVAVALVLGLAFATLVTSFMEFILLPLLSALFSQPDLRGSLVVVVGDSQIRVGAFLNAVIDFVLIALALFLVVKALNRVHTSPEAAPTELDLLTEIRDELRNRR
jgi:large conductance mechanosensitive channel